ncbi:unnamed protein product, partial [Rotaria sp. Silwood2]
CESNGINYDAFQRNHGGVDTNIEVLEMFFSGLPRLISLKPFPNLLKLVIVNQTIERIEGLDACTNLQELWITECTSLAENTELEVLNLADNKISSFQDITILTMLPKLRNIAFSDPVYGGRNPVASMANYHVHILYHLPQLEYIDGLHITTRQVAEQAEATVTKKKMWYHMKSKTLEREYDEFQVRLRQLRKKNEHVPEEHIRLLNKYLQRLKQELHLPERNSQTRSAAGDHNERERSEKQIEILRQRLTVWQNILNNFAAQYETAHMILLQQKAQLASRIQLELISGGNIRFEEGDVNDVWFNAAKDLLLSRFCSSIYSRYHITGIKIHRITRLFNRPKKLQFDHSLDFILDEDDDPIKTKSIQSKLEYLFYCIQPLRRQQNDHMYQFTTIESISEHGFPNAEIYKQLGQEEAIPFSNSLAVSDYLRIEQAGFQNRDKYRFGSVLMAKIYIGSSTTTPVKELPFPDYTPDSSFNKGHCDCGAQQQQWFLFDPLHAYAEYIIEYEYLFSVSNNTLSDQLSRIKLEKIDDSIVTTYQEEISRDNFILPSKDDELPPKISELTEDKLLKIVNETNLSNIIELNLACCNLQSIKILSELKNLRTLNLTFNDLVKLDELCYFYALESIDLSYNKLTTLDGIKGLTKLISFIAANNFLKKSLDDILTLKRYCTNLLHLDLRGNPLDK